MRRFAYFRFLLDHLAKYDIDLVMLICGVVVSAVATNIMLKFGLLAYVIAAYLIGFVVGELFAYFHKRVWTTGNLFWFRAMSFLWGFHLMPPIIVVVGLVYYFALFIEAIR